MMRWIFAGLGFISFLVGVVLFSDWSGYVGGWTGTQAGPLIVALTTTLTLGIWFVAAFIAAILLVLVVLTKIFGRCYCSLICPLGILQDGMISIFKMVPQFKIKFRSVRDYRVLRYGIAAFALTALVIGWAYPWRLLDPFSIFGMISSGLINPLLTAVNNDWFPLYAVPVRPEFWTALTLALILFLILCGLLLWRGRVFCTILCPVGTMLGIFARGAVYQVRMDGTRCVHCGQCVKVCPAGCIEMVSGVVDNERCVRCMRCLSVCRLKGLRYGKAERTPVAVDPVRRQMLLGTAVAVTGATVAALTVRRSGCGFEKGSLLPILPPGAGSVARFNMKCTGCQLCVVNCTGNVLRPAAGQFGAGFTGKPHLKFEAGMCEFDCLRCVTVCPTGAIRKMPLPEKKRCRIGMAVYDPTLCVSVLEGTDCGACAEHCPTGALRMEPDARKIRIPKLYEELCIGCGSCESACPVRPIRSVVIESVEIQVLATDPEVFFKRVPKVEAAEKDEWAF